MFASLLLTVALGAEPTTTWPGFRGDGSNTTAARHLPVRWSPTEAVAWRTPLPGYGQSCPVVWGDRVYLTSVAGDQKEKLSVAAVDAKSGKVVWTKEFAAGQKGKNNPMMSRAAPTPVADAAGVYAFFEAGNFVALTHAGERVWERNLAADYGAFQNHHGLGSSPAQTESDVVVLVDDAGPSYLVALDKKTGRTHWKADRPSRTGWTSPVAATLDGRPAVLASGGGTLTAYDAASGREVARVEGLVGNTIPSPTVSGEYVVVGAGENRTKPDLAASARSNCCVRLTAAGGNLGFEPVWQSKKVISQHASPLVHRGHVYFVTKAGFVHCLDLKTGEERYEERLDDPCWATPVGAGDRVYFFGKGGVTTVLRAGPEYEKVGVNRLWSADDFARRQEEAKKQAADALPKPTDGKGPGGPPLPAAERDAARYSAVGDVVYGVAAVDRTFFVRTGTELICVREPAPGGKP